MIIIMIMIANNNNNNNVYGFAPHRLWIGATSVPSGARFTNKTTGVRYYVVAALKLYPFVERYLLSIIYQQNAAKENNALHCSANTRHYIWNFSLSPVITMPVKITTTELRWCSSIWGSAICNQFNAFFCSRYCSLFQIRFY